jgi:uncharacterized protein (DUF1501 family)
MTNRRDVLNHMGAASLSLALPRLAFSTTPEHARSQGHHAEDRRLVLIFLRGGMDALSAVPPYGDPLYASRRGSLAIAAPGQNNGAFDLDGHFGLSPYLPEMYQLYAAKQLAVVHAVASPYRERSHFDAQNLIENGTTKPFGRDVGWLNLALGLVRPSGVNPSGQAGAGQASATSLGFALGQSIPLVLRGPAAVGSWSPSRLPQPDSDTLMRLSELYRGDPLLGSS